MNRLSRDQLINRALDMADSPSLDAQDRPTGTVIDPSARSILWLQDALDLFHHEFPWAGLVTTASVSIVQGTSAYTLPTDFVLDVRDGLTLTADTNRQRVRRTSLQKYISAQMATLSTTQGTPTVYVVQPPNLKVFKTPDKTYTATLWYYQLPSILTPGSVPNFPSDYTLVEYIRLRALEWQRSLPVGSALKYAKEGIAELRKAGLGHEPEDDVIPFDRSVVIPGAGLSSAPWDWMGDTQRVL